MPGDSSSTNGPGAAWARPIHDGRWGKATLEVALAIQQSAGGKRVTMHQVAVNEKGRHVGDGIGSRITAHCGLPARGIYEKTEIRVLA